ncbi:MAG TPA: hypothetical protein VI451_13935 [Anaerolineales bacterium]|jgi:thioredoxin-related protein|nr:hypothetical protein [Anaerolineales bacterium]
MAPIVHGLEAKYNSQINFVYLDIDDANTQRFKEALDYIYQPHIFLLDENGNIIQQWVGYVSLTELETVLVSAIQ